MIIQILLWFFPLLVITNSDYKVCLCLNTMLSPMCSCHVRCSFFDPVVKMSFQLTLHAHLDMTQYVLTDFSKTSCTSKQTTDLSFCVCVFMHRISADLQSNTEWEEMETRLMSVSKGLQEVKLINRVWNKLLVTRPSMYLLGFLPEKCGCCVAETKRPGYARSSLPVFCSRQIAKYLFEGTRQNVCISFLE